MPRTHHITLFILILLGLLPTSSSAFKRAESPQSPGVYLFWPQREVSYVINQDGSADVPFAQIQRTAEQSAAAWTELPCTDLRLVFSGQTASKKTNLTLAQGERPDQKNAFVWREEKWPPQEMTDSSVTADMPAVTAVLYNPETGEIVDADIDLNGVDFTWTATDDPKNVLTDVQNVLTHEMGHLLGLEHVSDPEATMFPSAKPGEMNKRSLAEDDIAGMCYVYPMGKPTPSNAPPSDPPDTGCQMISVPRESLALGLVLLGSWLAVHFRRRRPR